MKVIRHAALIVEWCFISLSTPATRFPVQGNTLHRSSGFIRHIQCLETSYCTNLLCILLSCSASVEMRQCV